LVRRLITCLTVWICLLGMIQPALACAPSGDCCPKGSPAADSVGNATVPAAIAVDGCCCAHQAITTSPWVAAHPRKALDQGAGPPASIAASIDLLVAQLPTRAAPLLLTNYRRNESLTYLRTARLRL
jgi:hypothetical protein